MSKLASDGRIRLGIVGLGMAGSIMVPPVLAHPEVILAGAAEPHDDLRERFSRDFSCPVTASIEALVERSDIDAVYIATPHQLHREHATLAASRGKHVVVEKPIALTIDDCEAMITAAREHNVALLVGHTHGFDAPVAKMQHIIESGRVGGLRMILAFDYTDFLYRPRRPEELDTSRGGGILFNQVPHQIDVIRRLAGSAVKSVLAATGRFDPDRPTEGAMMAMLGFDNGVQATVTYNGYDHFDSDELHGWIGEGGQVKSPSHGQARARLTQLGPGGAEAALRTDFYGYGGQMWQRLSSAEPPQAHPHFGVMIASCDGGDLRHVPEGIMVYGDGGAELEPLPPPRPGGGRSEVLDELCDAVLRGVAPIHDGEFGRDTLKVCLGILRSATDGRQVFVT